MKIALFQRFTIAGYYSLIAILNSSFLIPPHHKLHIVDSRLGLHMRDVGAGGEVVDVEGAAHVVDGEEG